MRSATVTRRVAIVDSPFQLLSLLEALDTEALEAPQVLITRGADFSALLEVGRPLLDGVRIQPDPGSRRLIGIVTRASELIAGDPYSTLLHAVLATPGRRRLAFIDDGAATLRALETFAGGSARLVRAHSVRRHHHPLGRMGHSELRRLARRGRVAVVTGLPVSAEQLARLRARGLVVTTHCFAWSRGASLPAVETGDDAVRSVVRGGGLAHDGLLEREFYASWLTATLRGEHVLYVPHRRDLPDARERALAAGAQIYTPPSGLPVELVVRDLPDNLVVHTLPSTAALTIPAIRGDTATQMRCTLPPAEATTARFTPAMRALQQRIHDLVVESGTPAV